jgi:outer membrane protein OmpA-like peptidoglycan-associated protein
MRSTSIKAALTGAGLLAAAILSVSAHAFDESTRAAQKLFEESAPWSLPNIPADIEPSVQYDSEPQTRSFAASRLVDRLGYPANQVARADRQHVDFAPGQANVRESAKDKLRQLVSGLDEHDQVIVTGYAGKEIPAKEGLELALRRGMAVVTVIKAANSDVSVRLDATPHWAGDDGEGQRAEVFVIPSLKR